MDGDRKKVEDGAELSPDAPASLPSYWNWKRFLPVGILMILGVAFFVTLFFLVRRYEGKRTQERFLPYVQRFMHCAESDLQALIWCGRLFASSKAVEQDEFSSFLSGSHLWPEHVEIESFEWIPRVPARERTEFEQKRGLTISQLDAGGRLVAVADGKGDFFPQDYYESGPGQTALPRRGFDYGADPKNRTAMEHAIQAEDGKPSATGPLVYPARDSNSPGLVKVRVFLPIYANQPDPALPRYHREQLQGFVAMLLVPGEMVRHAWADQPPKDIELILFDRGSDDVQWRLLVDPRTGGVGVPDPAMREILLKKQGPQHQSDTVRLGARTWAIVCRPRWGLIRAVQWESWLVLAGGLVLTALLSSYLYTLLGQAAYIENVVTRRTRELASMNVRLQNEIAERERGERALRNSEALYHSLVDTLPMNVLRKNLAGEITFGNKLYCETIKRPMETILGKTDFDLFPRPLAEKYVSDDRQVVETRQVFEDVEEHRKPDGTMAYMHVLKAPVTDALGKVVGTQVIFWDVTEKRRAEEALQQTLADLARSNRDLEQFAYVASHDLQEPLRMIASYTELLAKRYGDKLDQEAQEFVRFVVDGAVRMQTLISDLLVYSRLSTHGTPFAPTDCEEVLREALTNLQMAIDESCALVTHDPLPTVMADHMQLLQLFQNLVANALKFRGPASPEIHISARQEDREWILSVRDNGLGIDPKFAERIFVIFQRLHARDKYPGTGIGLAICKKIIERHGGRIWVESEPGRGATFYVTLPVMRPSGGD